MHKLIPYNTGKVAIGSRFEPVKHNTMSPDEEFIQELFLGEPIQLITMPYDKAIYVLGLVALLVVWLTS